MHIAISSLFLLIFTAITCFASSNESIGYVYIKFPLNVSYDDPEVSITDSVYVDSIVNAFQNAKNSNESCLPDTNVLGFKMELQVPGIGETTLHRGCTSCCGADSGRVIEKLLYRAALLADSTLDHLICHPALKEVTPEECNNSSGITPSKIIRSDRFIPALPKSNTYSLDGKVLPENTPSSLPGVQKNKTPKVVLPGSSTKDSK